MGDEQPEEAGGAHQGRGRGDEQGHDREDDELATAVVDAEGRGELATQGEDVEALGAVQRPQQGEPDDPGAGRDQAGVGSVRSSTKSYSTR